MTKTSDDDLAAARACVQEQYDEAVERWFSEGRYEESGYDSPPVGREIGGWEAEHWFCYWMGAVAGGGTFLLLWLRDDWSPLAAVGGGLAAWGAVAILLGKLLGVVVVTWADE